MNNTEKIIERINNKMENQDDICFINKIIQNNNNKIWDIINWCNNNIISQKTASVLLQSENNISVKQSTWTKILDPKSLIIRFIKKFKDLDQTTFDTLAVHACYSKRNQKILIENIFQFNEEVQKTIMS